MSYLANVNIVSQKVFKRISELSASMSMPVYLIGGYVRDLLLGKENDDIDFCVIGSGTDFAEALAKIYNGNCDVYLNYGTAKVGFEYEGVKFDLEFVGARREFYKRGSRNPIVENGTLDDDMARRDFTINDMAISLCKNSYGELLDPYHGRDDLQNQIIRCVSNPEERFQEDPLRMLRAIRFAARFHFKIEYETFKAIQDHAVDINIIVRERILEELNKMIGYDEPGYGFDLLLKSGLMHYILPELEKLDEVSSINGVHHKNNFIHSVKVLNNVAEKNSDIWVRWTALLHDIGKAETKEFDRIRNVWTFYNHEEAGVQLLKIISERLGFPTDKRMSKMSNMIRLHMRPTHLCSDEVSDSGIRRFIVDAGDDLEDLLILCESDLTTSHEDKKAAFLEGYRVFREKVIETEKKDNLRNMKLAFSGDDIMKVFNLKPSAVVGEIKKFIKQSFIDGTVANKYEDMKELAEKWVTDHPEKIKLC